MPFPDIIFVVGPTGVGKSDVAGYMAEEMNAEIISCDAMQVYKDVNIASGKPCPTLLRRVRHHLIGEIPVEEDFDVARYKERAEKALAFIRQKGKVPLVVGGTGLYMSVLLDGLFAGSPKDESLRRTLERLAEREGGRSLHRRLADVDPVSAKRIHPHDLKRIVRALEVFELEKRPISEIQRERKGWADTHVFRIFGLERPREELYARINARVEGMFQQGIVKEIKELAGRRWSRTARGIIGFREIKAFLGGGCTLDEAKAMIKTNSRRYAKRQLTWLRRDKRLEWVAIPGEESPHQTAKRLRERLMEGC